MAGGAFIGWVLDKVPKVWDWAKKKGRANEVDKIDTAVDTNNDVVIRDKLRHVKEQYERQVKGNS
jgi:hypothetical protein